MWQVGNGADSLAHVAALVNMAYAGATNGHDQEGMHFLQTARYMAERLGLDDTTTSPAFLQRKSTVEPLTDDLRFRAHVAWGYFLIVKYVICCSTITKLLTNSAGMPSTTTFLPPEALGPCQSQDRHNIRCPATRARAFPPCASSGA